MPRRRSKPVYIICGNPHCGAVTRRVADILTGEQRCSECGQDNKRRKSRKRRQKPGRETVVTSDDVQEETK